MDEKKEYETEGVGIVVLSGVCIVLFVAIGIIILRISQLAGNVIFLITEIYFIFSLIIGIRIFRGKDKKTSKQ